MTFKELKGKKNKFPAPITMFMQNKQTLFSENKPFAKY